MTMPPAPSVRAYYVYRASLVADADSLSPCPCFASYGLVQPYSSLEGKFSDCACLRAATQAPCANLYMLTQLGPVAVQSSVKWLGFIV